MKIINITKNIKCDTLRCDQNASIKIELNSYKEDLILCSSCFKLLKSLLKKDTKNETK